MLVTSAALRTGQAEVSHRVMGPMAERPAMMASQISSTVRPAAQTAPAPVMEMEEELIRRRGGEKPGNYWSHRSQRNWTMPRGSGRDGSCRARRPHHNRDQAAH